MDNNTKHTPITDAIVAKYIGNDHVSAEEANELLDHARRQELVMSELLEVVKLAADVGCHERAVDYLRDKARAAIAKVTG